MFNCISSKAILYCFVLSDVHMDEMNWHDHYGDQAYKQ